MLRCDKIVMEIRGNSTKENFLDVLGKLLLKFEKFSGKILSRSWLNLWKNLLKFLENFQEWMKLKF